MKPKFNWAKVESENFVCNGRRILQVHPSLLCNFECSHCYSSSSWHSKNSLEASYVVQTIQNAFEQGYDKLSISGGEPLLYPFLKEVLTVSKRLGMSTSLITNGSFPESKYRALKGLVNTIAVSIDGDAALHNSIRKNKNSFNRADNFLDFAKTIFPSVGISFTLTDESWEYLPALIEYAETKDVDIFQIYPLERNGRAAFNKYSVSNETLMRAYVLAQIFNGEGNMDVHLNCFSKSDLRKFCTPKTESHKMADVIDLIVLNELGELLPYTYGLSPAFKLADNVQPLRRESWINYKENFLVFLTALCDSANQFCMREEGYFLNYHQILRDLSHSENRTSILINRNDLKKNHCNTSL